PAARTTATASATRRSTPRCAAASAAATSTARRSRTSRPGSATCAATIPPTGFRQGRGNGPADPSIAVDVDAHVGDFVSHLVGEHGTAAGGGVRYYGLDNEPVLWGSTHPDARGTAGASVRPIPASYDEVWSKGLAAALEIKSRDAGAEVMGPDTGGGGDLWSSAQAAADGFCISAPARAAHGNLPW